MGDGLRLMVYCKIVQKEQEMLTATQFVTNADKLLFNGEMDVRSAEILASGLMLRDLEIVDMVVRLFERHIVPNDCASKLNDVIPYSLGLRNELGNLRKSLTGGD